VRRYAPQIGALLLTKRCNLHCSYCNTAKLLKEAKGNWRDGEATLDKTKAIVANPLFEHCVLIDLLGGEPLLVGDIDRIVAYLTEQGYMTNMSTNGILLAERIADLKRAGLSRINVSMYRENRAVLERDLAKSNQVFRAHSSLVLLGSEVEHQQESLFETVRFARDAGCLSMRFFAYRPMGNDPRPAEIVHATLPAYREFRKRLDAAFPGFCLWPAAITSDTKKRCPQLWQRVGCDMLGNMGVCCGYDDLLPGEEANLFRDDPDVLYNHPTMVAMRRQLLDPTAPAPEMCRSCNLLGDPGW
jgi:organic radical activating enzyme